jgi:hypothetical protein
VTKRNPGLKKNPRGSYDTPPEAILPLLPYLKKGCRYAEPCAGKGLLIEGLKANGFTCGYAGDIAPRARSMSIERRDALTLTKAMLDRANVDLIITNTPWTIDRSREVQHALINHFFTLRPAWLLIDSDWMHTVQSSELIKRCSKIVSVGRVQWIKGSESVGYDNCAWHYFPQRHFTGPVFIGRTGKEETI